VARTFETAVEFMRVMARRFVEDRCMQIASTLTFTTLLSLVPLITVALTMISAFPVFGTLTQSLQQFMLENLLPQSVHVLTRYAEQFTSNAAKLTAVGIAFLAVTAVMLLMTIEQAFNEIWRVRRRRSMVQRVFIYWALLTIGPLLLGASLSLTYWFVSFSLGFVQNVPAVSMGVLRAVPIALIWAGLTLLYLAMPNRRIRFSDALFGGLLASLAFEVTKHGFAFYIAQFPTYKLVYGAFASVPIFLMWIYISWLIVLFGALVVAELPEWRERAWQAEPAPGTDFFDALLILKLLWRAHRQGNPVSMRELHAAVKRRVDRIEAMLETMAAAQWVGRVGSRWTLIKDPKMVRVSDLFHLFVFRSGAELPAREAGADLDALARSFTGKVESDMQMSLEELFAPDEAEGPCGKDRG
jgi:membrane protein